MKTPTAAATSRSARVHLSALCIHSRSYLLGFISFRSHTQPALPFRAPPSPTPTRHVRRDATWSSTSKIHPYFRMSTPKKEGRQEKKGKLVFRLSDNFSFTAETQISGGQKTVPSLSSSFLFFFCCCCSLFVCFTLTSYSLCVPPPFPPSPPPRLPLLS